MKLEVQRTLEAIYDRDGALSPSAIVEAARPKNSPLHQYFTWNSEKAADAYRLDQARALIRVAVKVLPQISNQPVRQYVSLSDLRKTGGGSYLATIDVMADDERRGVALNDAIRTLQALQRRFRYLPELEPIWDALATLTSEAEAA